jgi:hypothetical protein
VFSFRIPDGTRCRENFFPSELYMVCPALAPPYEVAQNILQVKKVKQA